MKKVLLGMSGGVDSSVAAALLKEKGYEVIGCTMKLWDFGKDNYQPEEDAKKVCDKLGISHCVLDYQEEFRCRVIQNFIEEYQEARTPNPCIECNRYLKFGVLYEKAKELGCDYIATGHYAKIEYSDEYQQMVLKKSEAEKKDQTYFLYRIPKEALEHIIFPLEGFQDKEEIREIAEKYNLVVAKKKDSQEICFIPDNDYKLFLEKNGNKKKSGEIVLKSGEVLGIHDGLVNYTIGQRKGIGISYPKPLYVIGLNPMKNQVMVGEEKDLYEKELVASEVNWLVLNPNQEPLSCLAKIRYRAKEAKATVYPIEGGKVRVVFEEPQRAITKGQSVVFYDKNEIVLGGGKIN